MSSRRPLIEVTNDAFPSRPRPKVTYGKKSRAQTNLDLFNEIDKRFASFTIVEDENIELETDPKPEIVIQVKEFAAERPKRSPLRSRPVPRLRKDDPIRRPEGATITTQVPKSSPTQVTRSLSSSSKIKRQIRLRSPVHSSTRTTRGTTSNQSSPLTSSIPPQSFTESSHPELDDFITTHCDRTIYPFQRYGDKVSKRYNIRKIGEGSYSSVFALNRKPSPSKSAKEGVSGTLTTILKLMPLHIPDSTQKDLETPEGLTTLSDLSTELSTLCAMDAHHGFLRYRSTILLTGPWHESFLSSFESFSKIHPTKALNEHPSSAYPSGQLYALIEMEDAGVELDTLKRISPFQARDIFWSTALHLASAEEQVGFEHRDLHVSNICIRSSNLDTQLDVSPGLINTVSTTSDPASTDLALGCTNLTITLIDYTFSRLELANCLTNHRPFILEGDDYESLVAQNYLNGKPRTKSRGKWRGTNRAGWEDRLQQLTYAKVVHAVENPSSSPCISLNDDATVKMKADSDAWAKHVPTSNTIWLGYLISVLLDRMGKTSKTMYLPGTAECEQARKIQDDIVAQLKEIRAVIGPEVLRIEDLPRAAAEVVTLGIRERWIRVEEIERWRGRLVS